MDVSPAELVALERATREGEPFLFTRDGDGTLRFACLQGARLVLGRAPGSEIEVAWDPRVSGVHAYLERRGRQWGLQDDGLSRNGTLVNGERLRGQRALRDGDVVQVGDTLLAVHDPQAEDIVATLEAPAVPAPRVSQAQRRVLVSLCRPFAGGRALRGPREQPADRRGPRAQPRRGEEPHAGAVRRVRVEDLPPNEKRTRLAERVLTSGVVRVEELGGG
jgi:FHA domain